MMELLFNCAICQRDVVDYPNRNGRDRQLSPLCRYCEGYWTDRGPQAGAFMDRRITGHIAALANCLHNEATLKQWSRHHGFA